MPESFDAHDASIQRAATALTNPSRFQQQQRAIGLCAASSPHGTSCTRPMAHVGAHQNTSESWALEPRTSLIYDQARRRVEQQLRKLWELFGPLSLGELSDLMDGAQDAVREWMPEGYTAQPSGELAPLWDPTGEAGTRGLGRCGRCGESFRASDERAEIPGDHEGQPNWTIHAACLLDGEQLA